MFYETPKMGADDTALAETIHVLKYEFETHGWHRMQAALWHGGWVVNQRRSGD